MPYNCLKSLSSIATGIKESKLLESSEKKSVETQIQYYTWHWRNNKKIVVKKNKSETSTRQYSLKWIYIMEFQVFIRISTVNIFVTV